MLAFLRKPFPVRDSSRRVFRTAFLIGLFVFLFLHIFRPFGISEIENLVWFATGGYGFITFLSILIVEFGGRELAPSVFNEDKWTVGKEIINVMIVILIVATGNYLFSVWLNFFEGGPGDYLRFIGFAMAVAIFPVGLQVLLRQNRIQKKRLAEAEKLTKELGESMEGNENVTAETEKPSQPIELINEEGQLALSLLPGKILAFESADNYVKLWYLKNDDLSQLLIRNSLKHFEDQFAGMTAFFRCHRSFLVNLDHLQEVRGNARGYQLVIHPDLRTIPVSRRKSTEFNQLVKSLN